MISPRRSLSGRGVGCHAGQLRRHLAEGNYTVADEDRLVPPVRRSICLGRATQVLLTGEGATSTAPALAIAGTKAGSHPADRKQPWHCLPSVPASAWDMLVLT